MACPNTEDGFVRLATELYRAINRFDFSKRQLKLLHVVIVQTYGFGKKADDITVQRLADEAGLRRSHASAALQELSRMGVLQIEKGRYGYLVSVKKDYDQWVPLEKPRPETGRSASRNGTEQPSQNGTVGVPKQDGPRPETGRPPSQNGTHNRQSPIDNPNRESQKREIDALFDRFYAHYPKRAAKGRAREAFRRLCPTPAFVEHLIEVVQLQEKARARKKAAGHWVPEWKHADRWLDGECWDDEIEDLEAVSHEAHHRGHESEAERVRRINARHWEPDEAVIDGTVVALRR